MSRTVFTEEQIKMLADNPNTYRVTSKILSLTKEFKKQFYEEYQAGKPARDILEDHGYPADVLGESRIDGIVQTVRKEAARPKGFSEGNGGGRKRALAENDPQEEIKQLQEEAEHLEQGIEYLKRIFLIGSSGK